MAQGLGELFGQHTAFLYPILARHCISVMYAFDLPDLTGDELDENWQWGTMFCCSWCKCISPLYLMTVVDCHEQTDVTFMKNEYQQFICLGCTEEFNDDYFKEIDEFTNIKDFTIITCMVVDDIDFPCNRPVCFIDTIKVTVTYTIDKGTFYQKQLVRIKYICEWCQNERFLEGTCEPTLSVCKPEKNV